MPLDYRDYILIKEIYHCKPSDLENEDENKLNLHFQILMLERKEEYLKSKRKTQK